MSKKLILGALSIVAGVALASACGSSKSHGSGSGGSSGSGGAATGGNGGSGGGAGKDGGSTGGSGGAPPYADANLDAPYQLPDGGCGQIFCPVVVNAACSNSPPSLDACAKFCTQADQSKCASQWDAMLTCAGATPQITCDSSGKFAVAGCDSQLGAFWACVSSDGGP